MQVGKVRRALKVARRTDRMRQMALGLCIVTLLKPGSH